jgi:cytochrome oxidase Cu insertion factor (SCO1/SenC/PrrC family)
MRSRVPLLMLIFWLAATMGMWLLAFYRMPEATPEWLLRAQSVCFGSTESGLPDTYGWMVLILSPLLFLFVFGAAYANELMDGLVYAYRTIAGKVIILLLVFTISSEAAWVLNRVRAGNLVDNASFAPVRGESLPEEYPRTMETAFPFALTDQFGNVSGPADYKGTPFILSFAFANCQTICPAILAQLKSAVKAMDHRIPVLIVTLDPWRDRPSKLDTMAQVWELGPRSRLYSGDVDSVLDVLNKYRVPISRNEQNGEVTHPPLVYIVDAEGRIVYTFNNPTSDWITNAIARIEH